MRGAAPTMLYVDAQARRALAIVHDLQDFCAIDRCDSAAAALCKLTEGHACEVVVAHADLADMAADEFLAHVSSRWPARICIRIADVDTSAHRARSGAPVSMAKCVHGSCTEEILDALRVAIVRSGRMAAEQQILETTFTATVATFSDVLALSSPWSFRRAVLARSCTTHALQRLGWSGPWMYEVAAALSQIGAVGLPEDILRRDAIGRPMTAADARLVAQHPENAFHLLHRIPGLHTVAQIVRYQARPVLQDVAPEVRQGAQLLHAALVLGRHVLRGQAVAQGLRALRFDGSAVDASILDALADFGVQPHETQALDVANLKPGCVLSDDVSTIKGRLLLSKGHELSEAAVYTLRRLRAINLIQDPIYVHTVQNAASEHDFRQVPAAVRVATTPSN